MLSLISAMANETKRCPQLAGALKDKNTAKALQLRQPQICPILSRLMTWKALTQQQNTMMFQDYEQFVQRYPTWPWLHEIRLNGEKSLKKSLGKIAPQLQVKQCEHFFKNGLPYTWSGLTFYVDALQHAKQINKAQYVLKQFWQQRTLNHGDTKKFLINYARFLSKSDHGARLAMLLHKNDLGTVELILPYIESDNTALKCLHLLVTRPDQGMKIYPTLPLKIRLQPEVASIYFKKLVKSDFDQAILFLINNPSLIKQHYPLFDKTMLGIIRDLIEHKNYQQAITLLQLIPEVPDHKYFLLGLVHYLAQDYEQAAHSFIQGYKLQQAVSHQAQHAYWTGKAFDQHGDDAQAATWWHKAAVNPRTYYGQQAYEKLGLDLQKDITKFVKPTYSDQDMTTIKSNALVHAIKYLSDLGLESEVPAFIYTLRHDLKTTALKHAALAYISRISPTMVCELAQITHCIHDLKVTYPQLYNKFLDKNIADKSLSLSVIRKESSFYPKAQSPVGALGLMQIMLPTAQSLCKKMGCLPSKQRLLGEPQFNLQLGQHYLRELLTRYDGSILLAVAAYNAGYGNINKWRTRFGDPQSDIDPDIFIELIPFKETRHYVKQVLETIKVYQAMEN